MAYGTRASAGIRPERAIDHGATASLYYRDPDGNELELYANLAPPRPLAPDARVPWEPEALVAALAEGADDEALRASLDRRTGAPGRVRSDHRTEG